MEADTGTETHVVASKPDPNAQYNGLRVFCDWLVTDWGDSTLIINGEQALTVGDSMDYLFAATIDTFVIIDGELRVSIDGDRRKYWSVVLPSNTGPVGPQGPPGEPDTVGSRWRQYLVPIVPNIGLSQFVVPGTDGHLM